MVIDFYIFPPHACTPFCVFHFTNNILIVWKFFCHPLYIVHTITTYASRLTLVFYILDSQSMRDFSQRFRRSSVRNLNTILLEKYNYLYFPINLRELTHGTKPIGRSVECTSSVLDSLVLFKGLYPRYRSQEIRHCIRNAAMFIENKQRKDGSW
jgi:hypothetical protein